MAPGILSKIKFKITSVHYFPAKLKLIILMLIFLLRCVYRVGNLKVKRLKIEIFYLAAHYMAKSFSPMF